MIKEIREGCLLDVEIKPHSEAFSIEGLDPWQNRVKIRVKASPLKGKANRELLSNLKQIIGADVEIVKGEHSTKKTLLIRAKKGEIKKRLNL
ncbi:YggU family protein [Candidatus Micrarchaeota archaeon]|nr:MAG: YggU family protein [Candidatus Micrarchaeota archaeon]